MTQQDDIQPAAPLPLQPQPQLLKLTGWEKFWYVCWNIVTLGFPYLVKILLKKAAVELHNQPILRAQADAQREAWRRPRPTT